MFPVLTKCIQACQAFFITEGKVFTWKGEMAAWHNNNIHSTAYISLLLVNRYKQIVHYVVLLFYCFHLYSIHIPIPGSGTKPLSSGFVFKFCHLRPHSHNCSGPPSHHNLISVSLLCLYKMSTWFSKFYN